MSLKDVCAKLSTTGSQPTLNLVHLPSQETLQSLRLVRATPEHRSFILGTWVKSYRSQARKENFGGYYDKYEPGIAESRWEDCWVATDEDGYTVYAWVCGETGNLWHVYVVPELRRKGVADSMILHACGTLYPDIAKPFYKGRLNPYLLCKKEVPSGQV